LSQTRPVLDNADREISFYFILGTRIKNFDPSSDPDIPIGNADKETLIIAH